MKKLLVLVGLVALAAGIASMLRKRVVDQEVEEYAPGPSPARPADEFEDLVVEADDGDDTNDEPDEK